jgi:RNA-directed DNA polymerase
VITDRCLQAVALNALEPEWEARFEPRSYGFRPGRGCHDAIGAIFLAAKGKSPKRQWILDADLAAAFDRINHDHLLASVGQFPAQGLVEQWLKAGVVDGGSFAPTEEGVPQGGIISPVLMNVALHGMEEAAGVRYRTSGPRAGELAVGSPTLIRYADDLVVLCHSRDEAQQVKERLAEWLTPRGLAFNEDKTRIAHLDEGCDFLGFNVRRYHGMLLIKPSKAGVRRIRARLTAEVLALRGQNAAAVIAKLNPIIRGWAAYYRGVVSSEVFTSLETTCGGWSTSGPGTRTRTSRGAGSRPGTSAGSTPPGRTGGSSATGRPAAISPSSPGPRSSDTSWSSKVRPWTTRP